MPGYRGRLIFPMKAALFQLDTLETSTDPKGDSTVDAGYDPDFREPIKLPAGNNQGPGTTARREKPVLYLPCQVEVPKMDQAMIAAGGTISKTSLNLVFHFADIEALGLLDARGRPTIRLQDRLGAIYTMSGALQRDFTETEMFATEIQENSYGLSAGVRNLLIVTFDVRDKGIVS